MSVRIAHLHSRFHTPEPLAPERLQAWQEAFTEGAPLDPQTLAGQAMGPDEWLLIRQLDLRLQWRHDSASSEVGHLWLNALQAAVTRAASQPDHPGVLRYRSRRHGLADLMYRSALGETARQWAWRRMDLIPSAGLGADQALRHGLRCLLGEPSWIWPTVCQWVAAEPGTAALTALLRALPATAWQELLMAAVPSRAYARGMSRIGQRALERPATESLRGGASWSSGLASPLAVELNVWLQRRPHLAVRHGETLAVLLAALAWPDQGSDEQVVQARLSVVWERVRAAAQSLELRTVQAASRSSLAPAAAPDGMAHESAPAQSPASVLVQSSEATETALGEDVPAAPSLPELQQWVDTDWAGALFWLRQLDERQLSQGNRGHALMAIALALGVPGDDAALRAFVGGQLPEGQPTQAQHALAASQVAAWSDWLARHAPDLPEPRLTAVCQRPGRLRFEPGWIELHLRLDQADTRLRRLGLDLDPGYLPWLGCVVRICYD